MIRHTGSLPLSQCYLPEMLATYIVQSVSASLRLQVLPRNVDEEARGFAAGLFLADSEYLARAKERCDR